METRNGSQMASASQMSTNWTQTNHFLPPGETHSQIHAVSCKLFVYLFIMHMSHHESSWVMMQWYARCFASDLLRLLYLCSAHWWPSRSHSESRQMSTADSSTNAVPESEKLHGTPWKSMIFRPEAIWSHLKAIWITGDRGYARSLDASFGEGPRDCPAVRNRCPHQRSLCLNRGNHM